MKHLFTWIFFLLMPCYLISQEKEWKALAAALNKEVQSFAGKKGYVMLSGGHTYNNFEIRDGSVSQGRIFIRTFLYDRFGNLDHDILNDEFLEVEQFSYWASLCEWSILYNHLYYYEDYPETLFIKLTTCPDVNLPRQTNTRMTFFAEDEPLETITEDEVTELILPVRAKRLPKLMRLLNAYMESTIKPVLDGDRTH